jgi:Cu2+-exporting ATPase
MRLRLGRADFALRGADAPGNVDDAVVLADDAGAIAILRVHERLRPGAHDLVERLRGAGLTAEIVSGDGTDRVAAVAARLGIAHWFARQRPADKLARLAALRAEGARVIAIGDGINDAPVLAGADAAIALASGADLAQVASDIVFVGDNLGVLADARTIASDTLTALRQNQRWALAYNLAAVPLAALGFVPPWLAAFGMSLSSLVVVLNALRIGRRRERDPAAVAHVEVVT